MKGFKNTTRMQVGHNPSSAGRTVGRVPSFARGGAVRRFAEGGTVGGLDESFDHESKESPTGNAMVQRTDPQVSEELVEGGGRSPLRPGYAAGGAKKEKHFHVHNHYHNGKKMPGKSKRTTLAKHAEKKATGGTIDKVKRGGKIHKAEGGIIPAARDPDGYGDYATGGTIDKFSAGGGLYATGGTINELGVGGMPMRPVQAGGPPQGALAAMQAHARPPMPMRPGMPAPMQGGQARPLMRAAGGITKAKAGRSDLGRGVGRGAAHISGKGIAKSR